jgi:hypothetical protein
VQSVRTVLKHYTRTIYTVKMNIDDAESIDSDIEDIVYVLENVSNKTDVQRRVSPVQFLRDRELGIRGTSERAVRQGVSINYVYAYDCPFHVRRKAYTWIRDNLCTFDYSDDYRTIRNEYGRTRIIFDVRKNIENKYALAKEIKDHASYAYVLHITIPIGNGHCTELLAVNVYSRFSNDDEPDWNPAYNKWRKTYYIKYDDDDEIPLDRVNQWPEIITRFFEAKFARDQYRVQNIDRYCKSCNRYMCKCSEIACDTC